ncbi:MAG: hypothetical protein D6680_11915 [Cyanobacteria bacterium J007]|nr:MAG: hypothetical protein D6680_11915 [Cyanobacteria bacterium J007]
MRDDRRPGDPRRSRRQGSGWTTGGRGKATASDRPRDRDGDRIDLPGKSASRVVQSGRAIGEFP